MAGILPLVHWLSVTECGVDPREPVHVGESRQTDRDALLSSPGCMEYCTAVYLSLSPGAVEHHWTTPIHRSTHCGVDTRQDVYKETLRSTGTAAVAANQLPVAIVQHDTTSSITAHARRLPPMHPCVDEVFSLKEATGIM